MDSDPNIRHSIIADSEGTILATNHRPEIANYLSPEETADSLKRAAIAWKGRDELIPKIGKGLYAIAVRMRHVVIVSVFAFFCVLYH